jgi:GNAT superfamily N-acetyltransferase
MSKRLPVQPISTKSTGCAFASQAHTLSSTTIATYDMTTKLEIRRATAADAEAVYEIVLQALRETNARDYPASVIDRLVLTLPKGVASKLEEWHAYVAVVDGRIIGTGSLNGSTVRAVFVHPDYQGRGIGTKLMNAVENAADVQSVNTLSVQSSITAQPFYAKRGFKVVREGFYGEERTIVMSKRPSE